jgi:hypothetical protein
MYCLEIGGYRHCKLREIKALAEQQRGGIDAAFRRRVVGVYELGFISIDTWPNSKFGVAKWLTKKG